jgi:TonB family protein
MRFSKFAALFSTGWVLPAVLLGCAVQPVSTDASADQAFNAQRYDQAVHEYLMLSKHGDVHAYARLGYLYEHGLGTGNAQPSMAMMWYEKAATKGDVDSAAALGNLYQWYNGYYLPAFKWDMQAAQAGNAVAEANLATLYEHGLGVTQNHPAAQIWQAKADQQAWGSLPEFSVSATSAIAAYMRQIQLPIPKGATGVARVEFDYLDDGQAVNVRISQSSGNEELDRLALKAVAGAVFPPMPPAVKARLSHFIIAINFTQFNMPHGGFFWPTTW